MTDGGNPAVAVILWLVGMYVLYWVIRYGVRDGIKDAQAARSSAQLTPPARSGAEPGGR